jgi:lipopolysaccharide biosynthesis glycosyltransferase
MEKAGRHSNERPIPVFFCADAGFCQHMAVTIASLLRSNSRHCFRLIVVLDKYDTEIVSRLRATIIQFPNAELEIKVFGTESFSHLRVSGHISLASYIRLFMTQIIDPDIDKVLYLDCDLVIRDDIEGLWNTDISNYFLAAVADPYSDNHVNLGFRPDEKYFNAGVLLVNLEKWRSANMLPTLIAYAEENTSILRYHDQCTLNAVFRGQVLFLSPRWNFPARNADLPASAFGMTTDEFDRLRHGPSIVHYTTDAKPWFYAHEPHYKKLYYEYLAFTPWRSFSPDDRNLATALKKLLTMVKVKQALKWHMPKLFRSVRAWTGLGDPFLRELEPRTPEQAHGHCTPGH